MSDAYESALSANGDDDLPDEPLSMVLDDLRDWLTSYVAYASPHFAVAVVLWTVHTHALNRAASTPRLAFTSPEPESGKTRNLELLELVVRRGRLVLQMSAASVYRWVDAFRPTILLDELDAVFGPKASKDHEDLRAIINAGHRPGATVPRVQVPSMQVIEFSCYCPVAVAGLRSLPDTIRSRAIVVPMRRRAPDEIVRPYRERVTRPEGDTLRSRIAAWVLRHVDSISEEPLLPAGVTDRQADQWEPLLAIADAAGGDWPDHARAACVEIVAAARMSDEQSHSIRLLSDIRDVIDEHDRIKTGDLTTALCDVDDAPWGDWLDGKSDKAKGRWLSAKLRPYGIQPRQHRFDTGTAKGYLASDFDEAWSRDLPPKGNKGNKGNAPASDVSLVALVSLGEQGEPNVDEQWELF